MFPLIEFIARRLRSLSFPRSNGELCNVLISNVSRTYIEGIP